MASVIEGGEQRSAESDREQLLRQAVRRFMVMGQVMRRAVQELRSELAEGCPPTSEQSKTRGDNRPEFGQAQFFVLHVLTEASPLAVGEIAERCHVSVPTISRILNHLEVNGLIERYINPTNRRAIRVVVTEAGRAAEAAMARQFATAIETVLSRLTNAELADLITAFGHLERLVDETE